MANLTLLPFSYLRADARKFMSEANYEKMIQALTDRVENKIDNGLELMRQGLEAIKESNKEELKAIKESSDEAKKAMEGKYKWLIGIGGFIALLLTIITVFVGIQSLGS